MLCCPPQAFIEEHLPEHTQQPRASQPPRKRPARPALEALADADADGAAPAPAAAEIFFRVIKSTPANSKTVKVALGAGQKVQSDFVAVTRHKRVMGYERILVDTSPASTGDTLDHVCLLGNVQNMEAISDSLLGWRKHPRRFYRLHSLDCHADDAARYLEVTTGLVEAGAVEGSQRVYAPACPHMQDALDGLCQAGVVLQCHFGREPQAWQLRKESLKDVQVCWELADPFRICKVRDGPLADLTCFELVSELQAAGWTWRQWVPPPKRPKRAHAKRPWPDGYSIGDPQVWLTTGTWVSKAYLLCLHFASEGLTVIPHGKDQQTYQQAQPSIKHMDSENQDYCHGIATPSTTSCHAFPARPPASPAKHQTHGF